MASPLSPASRLLRSSATLLAPNRRRTGMSGRTIAVGDVHGCKAALDALLAAIEPEPADTLVTLGDYVDRGPDSRGVLDRLIGLAGRCRLVPLMGNHEEALLDALRDLGTLRR